MTRWSQPVGDATGGVDGIQAMTEVEALEWAETHGIDADVIQAHFDVEDA